MRLIHLSDLHVTEGPRLDDQAATLQGSVLEASKLRPDAWLLTGDLYGHTVPHRSRPAERNVLLAAVRTMALVAPVVIIPGNHDHDEDVAGLENCAPDCWPVKVVPRAAAFELLTPSGVLHVYGLPYPTKRWLLANEAPSSVEAAQRAVESKLATLLRLWAGRIARKRADKPDEPHVFAGHLQIRGSTVGAGVVLAGQEIELTRDQLHELGVDYGALGHLHDRQEAAPRCWYAGSLWNTSHSSAPMPGRSWQLVDIAPTSKGLPPAPGGGLTWRMYDPDGARQCVTVGAFPSKARRFVTLDYRWAQPDDEQVPRWVRMPTVLTAANVEGGADVRDAEVRMRLVVPAQHVASCPWDDEIERVRKLGAHRVVPERVIEPVVRARAPQVAEAQTLDSKLVAYWSTLETPPTEAEQQAAIVALRTLRVSDDEQIEQDTDKRLQAAQSRAMREE